MTLLGAGSADGIHLAIDADADSPIGDVAAALEEVSPGPYWLDGQSLSGPGRVADSGLRDGVVVYAGPAPPGDDQGTTARPPGSEPVEDLAVVAGPYAGTSVELNGPEIVVGRDPAASLVLPDEAVSWRHARLFPTESAWTVEDLGSTNGTWVGATRLEGPTRVNDGTVLEIGASLLAVRARLPADADVHPDEDGGLAFNRPARIQPASAAVRLQAPDPPREVDSGPLPWLQALIPIAIAGGLYLVLHSLTVLLVAAMSPVMLVSGTLGHHRRQAKQRQDEQASYRDALERTRARMTEAAAADLAEARDRWMDPAGAARVATGPARRLWERRPPDDDFLILRLGVGRRLARVELAGPCEDGGLAVPELAAAPVVVDLPRAGVIGLAGPAGETRAVARWLATQIAIWHTPSSVQLQLLTALDGSADWDWFRWLPHARGDGLGTAVSLIGNDTTTCDDRIRALLKLLESRAAAGRDRFAGADSWSPPVVVILDGARRLRGLPGVARLLGDGPRHGIFFIALDTDSARLPEEGRAELAFPVGGGVAATLRVHGEAPAAPLLADQVSPGWAEGVARALSPLRDVGSEQAGAALPATARLVDLIGLDPHRPADLLGRWRSGGLTPRAPVGVSIDGPFTIDLKRDGPHALVAGTTGSGKSEFLQTLVASLAVANRPDAIHFVLVDYKGASAFADCAALPHTVGMVTNLDGRETQRALTSLEAELRRREVRLHELGAVDIEAAWEAAPGTAARAGLARLVLVIDEFAELAHELPEFVTGLMRIARVGRSLGVHLILATQRPAGVITAEIQANTGLRVALRMEGDGDSQEVIGTSDAARISRATPGRAYARIGGGTALVGFQSARVAGRRRGVTVGLPPPQVVRVGWARLGYPWPGRPPAADAAGPATDLHALVDCVREAARLDQVEPGPSPWLPALPDLIGVGDLPPPAPGEPVAFGLEDLPADQAQVPASFDVRAGPHLVAIGAARSGRSTLLRTLATQVCTAYPPDLVHLYGLDYGNGALLPLADLPHCGAVVRRTEGDRVERLVNRLIAEVDRRHEQLARHRLGDIAEQHRAAPPEERLPYILLVVDRWEASIVGYAADSGDGVASGLARLVREGPAAGVRVVLSGDRSLLTDRLVAEIDQRLVLRLSDRDDYRLAGLEPKQLPADPPAGRAVRAETGTEVQVAVLGPASDRDRLDPGAPAQAGAVRVAADRARLRGGKPSRPPMRVESLPALVARDEVVARADDRPARPAPRIGSGPLWVPLGIGGDEGDAWAVDLGALGGFVVAGPPRSGRSNALAAMVAWLAGRSRLAVVAPRPSVLSEGATARAVPWFGDVSAGTGEELVRLAGGDGPLVLVVDDAGSFARSEADEALRFHLREAGPGRVVAVVAGQVDDVRSEVRGVVGDARRAQAGVLLSPGNSFDGDLFGVRLPAVYLDRMPPGRGCLIVDGQTHLVQLAIA